VGDAAGYLDALTGEGVGAALAQASVLAACLAAGRPADYERAWRRVTRTGWALTSGLLWSRNQRWLGQRIVPAAARLPWLFTAIVNQVAWALSVAICDIEHVQSNRFSHMHPEFLGWLGQLPDTRMRSA
jgi:hypothetical protein